MDEDNYRSAYKEVNPIRCIFEKAITNQRCNCELKRKFVIATREGVACRSESAMKRCTSVLDSMRNNARFTLKVITVEGPMPHNKELQVQAGGMLALQSLLEPESASCSENGTTDEQGTVNNIHQTLESVLKKYHTQEQLPYGEIVKSIVKYQARPKRRKKK